MSGRWRRMAQALACAIAVLAVVATSAPARACDGDIDSSRTVDAVDLVMVLADWGASTVEGARSDLTDDGVVNAMDVAVLLASWGPCPQVPAWAVLVESSPDPAVVTDPSLRAAIGATGLAWCVRDRESGVEMLLVPPGLYAMGASPNDPFASNAEFPVHAVELSHAFYLGRYELTQSQFKGVTAYNPSYFGDAVGLAGGDRPVETVTYLQALNFASMAGMRLPTEAEWEYACRAGTTAPNYALAGQSLGDLAWYAPNSGFITQEVGRKAPNALGFHDMLGNVWEWCKDWYDGLYYGVSPTVDPPGPSAGSMRVVRGGSWYAPESNTRASFRGAVWQTGAFGDVGFRVARNP